MMEVIQVVTTMDKKQDAQKIAKSLIAKRLAACVQIVGPIISTYWWQDKIETAEEWMCIAKTEKRLYTELEKEIRENHPYDVPEILAMPVILGNQDYIKWLSTELKK